VSEGRKDRTFTRKLRCSHLGPGLICFCLVVLSCICTESDLFALDPARAIRDYQVRHWDQNQGLPANSVNAISQSKEGFLWLGSEEGLVRFDGEQFDVFDSINTPKMVSSRVYGLVVSNEDWLLCAGFRGVNRFAANGEIVNRVTLRSDLAISLDTILQDRSGKIWTGTLSEGLWMQQGDKMVPYTAMPRSMVNSLALDSGGDLWVASSAGLFHLFPNGVSAVKLPQAIKEVLCIQFDSKGQMWLGTDSGLWHGPQDHLTPVNQADVGRKAISQIYICRSGLIWVGFRAGGLGRYDPRKDEMQELPAGLSGRSETIFSMFEDREGNFWIGTREGLYCLSDAVFQRVGKSDGLPSAAVQSVLADSSGSVWVGTERGLAKKTGNAFEPVKMGEAPNSGPGESISALAESLDGSLWVGTRSAQLWNVNESRRVLVTTVVAAGSEPYAIQAIGTDPSGLVWVGTAGDGLFAVQNGRVVQRLTISDGLKSNDVVCMAIAPNKIWYVGTRNGLNIMRDGHISSPSNDAATPGESGEAPRKVASLLVRPDGSVLVGYSAGGIQMLQDGKWLPCACTTRTGLATNQMFSLVDDLRGHLWSSSNRGVSIIPFAELESFFEGQIDRVHSRIFVGADGLGVAECLGGNQSTATRSADGRIWIATPTGLAFADPSRHQADPPPPPVAIETVSDGPTRFAVKSDRRVDLPAGVQALSIRFAALTFREVERVRYRLRLIGADDKWNETNRRDVYYTGLRPGKYRFQVMACNPEGVWPAPTDSATVDFQIAPYFYQTNLFYVACFLLLLIAAWLVYRWRISQILAERGRLSRELHDTLGQMLVQTLWLIESMRPRVAKGDNQFLQSDLQRAATLIRESLTETRNCIRALRATVIVRAGSFVPALRRVVVDGVRDSDLVANLEVSGKPFQLGTSLEQALIRTAQEAIANARKHANASHFQAFMAYQKHTFSIVLEDDGIGFDVASINSGKPVKVQNRFESSGLGLIGLRERIKLLHCKMTIDSDVGKGCRITVSGRRPFWSHLVAFEVHEKEET
jgi:ligand-binding sensor domain-containing protein/signal transduction histidine kinase